MEYHIFVDKVKQAKKIERETGGICTELHVVSFRSFNKGIVKKISKSFTCKHCGHQELQSVFVTFKEDHQLTIFEAALLWSLFYHDELPHDYAAYHDCIAGKRFIDDIKEIRRS